MYINDNNQVVRSCRLPLSQKDRGNYQIRNQRLKKKKNMQIIVKNAECALMKKPHGQKNGFTPLQKNKRLCSLSAKTIMPDRPHLENKVAVFE